LAPDRAIVRDDEGVPGQVDCEDEVALVALNGGDADRPFDDVADLDVGRVNQRTSERGRTLPHEHGGRTS
jgi:hypothetical protein